MNEGHLFSTIGGYKGKERLLHHLPLLPFLPLSPLSIVVAEEVRHQRASGEVRSVKVPEEVRHQRASAKLGSK